MFCQLFRLTLPPFVILRAFSLLIRCNSCRAFVFCLSLASTIRILCVFVQLGDLINEAQNISLALHVHTGQRTLNPGWVELAAFLIAANDQSWFSYQWARGCSTHFHRQVGR